MKRYLSLTYTKIALVVSVVLAIIKIAEQFSEYEFYFVWNEDGFELHYNFGSSGLSEYKIIKMNYTN